MLSGGSDPYSPAPPPADEEPLPPELTAEITADADAVDPDDACEISPRSILEALLFVGVPSGEPLTSVQIAALMRGVRPAEIDALVRELNAAYTARARTYTIFADGAGYRLRLRREFERIRDKFHGRVRRARLSQAAIEVLSVVAYNEPLTSEQINQLRGTASGAILTQLVRRELLPPGAHLRSPARAICHHAAISQTLWTGVAGRPAAQRRSRAVAAPVSGISGESLKHLPDCACEHQLKLR